MFTVIRVQEIPKRTASRAIRRAVQAMVDRAAQVMVMMMVTVTGTV